nr:MAG TPA: hypothetical protein [Caudoviricetes sp.]
MIKKYVGMFNELCPRLVRGFVFCRCKRTWRSCRYD